MSGVKIVNKVPTVKVTARGQITIPKQLRDSLRLTPGSHVKFVIGRTGAITLKRVKSGDVRLLRGMIKSPLKRPVTVEEMNEAIARGYAGLP